jgi:hypothetical protein
MLFFIDIVRLPDYRLQKGVCSLHKQDEIGIMRTSWQPSQDSMVNSGSLVMIA